MTPEKVRRLDKLASQLAEILMTVVICVQEIHSAVHSEIGDELPSEIDRFANGFAFGFDQNKQRPLLDESTMSVIWNGKKVHLGHTLGFRLLERLARRPNQYVTHLDLLRDVWDDEELATASIRSQVRELRIKLRKGGMADLASAIRGHNGRYILVL
jgi:hypothetical protein